MSCKCKTRCSTPPDLRRRCLQNRWIRLATGSASVIILYARTMSGSGKQSSKIVSKSSGGGGGAGGAAGAPPIMPLASPLMGKKKKPFLGMPAPLGYVPGLGRG